MKRKVELDKEIIDTITKINNDFPELSKYISEMPVETDENDEVHCENLENYLISLEDIVARYAKTHEEESVEDESSAPDLDGYPTHPPSEDIYQKLKEETAIDTKDISQEKSPNEAGDETNEKDFINHKSGRDLDVPGAELDDQ